MNFKAKLADEVMRGRKTVTRRLANDNPNSHWYSGGCFYKVGRDYAVCPGRGKNAIGRVRITSVRLMTLRTLSTDEARREGFETMADFVRAWREINGSYDFKARVWRVEFEVVA